MEKQREGDGVERQRLNRGEGSKKWEGKNEEIEIKME